MTTALSRGVALEVTREDDGNNGMNKEISREDLASLIHFLGYNTFEVALEQADTILTVCHVTRREKGDGDG